MHIPKKSMFAVMFATLFFIFGTLSVLLLSGPAQGAVISLGMETSQDYEGSSPEDPLDIFADPDDIDPELGPRKVVYINMTLTYVSNTPEIIQDIVFHFDVHCEEDRRPEGSELYFETEPEEVRSGIVLPQQEYSIEVLFKIWIDRYVEAGDNEINIDVTCTQEPGVAGSPMMMGSGHPIFIEPHTEAEISFSDELDEELYIEPEGTSTVSLDIENLGNVGSPELEAGTDGLDDLASMGFLVGTEMNFSGGDLTVTLTSPPTEDDIETVMGIYLLDPVSGEIVSNTLEMLVRVEVEEEPPVPGPDDIEVDIQVFEYRSFRDDGNITSEILIEGTTSGCGQVLIFVYPVELDMDEHSGKIDIFDSEWDGFRYDGTGCQYHEKEFVDLSSRGDWSEFRLHVVYTIDMAYFKGLWEHGPVEVDEDSFPDVGDKMVFRVVALEEINDIDGRNGTWEGETVVKEGEDPDPEEDDPSISFGEDHEVDGEGLAKLIRNLLCGSLIILLVITGIVVFLIIIIIFAVVKAAGSGRRRS